VAVTPEQLSHVYDRVIETYRSVCDCETNVRRRQNGVGQVQCRYAYGDAYRGAHGGTHAAPRWIAELLALIHSHALEERFPSAPSYAAPALSDVLGAVRDTYYAAIAWCLHQPGREVAECAGQLQALARLAPGWQEMVAMFRQLDGWGAHAPSPHAQGGGP